MKSINILLLSAICLGIIILTIKSNEYSLSTLKRVTPLIDQYSYNIISIKQIDSLTADKNLKFSEPFYLKLKAGQAGLH